MTSITLSRAMDCNYWHVRGDISEYLSNQELQWFHHIALDENGFVARTGDTEFLVLDKPDSALEQQLVQLADSGSIHLFARDDAIFKLSGAAWSRLLLQVCSYDFSNCQSGQYITASMAGIGCWFKIGADVEQSVLLGCDPSYAHYLQEVLEETITLSV